MDDAENSPGSGGEGLEPRGPSVEDLVELCRILNGLEARYVVVGGFAVRGAGFNRMTMDIDLIIDTSLENEAKSIALLSHCLIKRLVSLCGATSRNTQSFVLLMRSSLI